MVQVLPGLAEAVENIGTNRKFWRSIVDLCADRIAEDDPVRRGAASSAKRAAEADGVLASAGVRAWKSRGNMRVGDREIRISCSRERTIGCFGKWLGATAAATYLFSQHLIVSKK